MADVAAPAPVVERPEPRLSELLARPGTFIALAWVAFQVYTAHIGFFPTLIHGAIHLAFALALALVGQRTVRELARPTAAVDSLLAVGALASVAYVLTSYDRYSTRIAFVDRLERTDMVVGLGTILLVLVVAQRVIGWPLTIVALVFLAYGFLGPFIPGPLGHRGMNIETFVELDFLSANGLYGIPLAVSAEVVFYFVVFGILLERSGGGQLFVDLAYTATARARGGAAKASVVSSGLFGTISGSAVANVVVDGLFTIPLMKRTGFRPHFAAAVEAAASTGGQIMPPVMGAAAFILAQFIGRPYAEVALAAAIPAILYYLSLYAIIDLEARRLGIATIPRSELPDLRRGLRERAHLLLPLMLLVYLIATGSNLATAALWASLAVLLVGFLRRATWMGPARIVEALASGAREAITVAAPTAVAGLIIGVVIYTGLALKFTGALQALAVGHVWLALVMVMLACLVLGMGMPTSAAYLMAAVLLGPALQRLGLLPLAAHLFIFYFAVISMVTPPVALAAYAAAGLAKTSMWQTGWTAFRLALAGFLIPYAFVFDPALILVGPLSETIWRTTTTAIGVVALAAAVVGYLLRPLNVMERGLIFAAAVLMIVPEKTTDFVGLALFALLIGFQWMRGRASAQTEATPQAGPVMGPTKTQA
jgi:TRAP transporter 4TM/12TM fusion protein